MFQKVESATPGTITRWALLAVIATLIILAMWSLRGILLLFLAAVILAVVFSLPVRFLQRHGVSKRVATVLSVLFFFVLTVVLSALTLPELIRQSYLLATVIIPQGVQALVDRWSSGDLQQQIPVLQNITPQDIQTLLDSLGNQIVGSLGTIGSSVLPLLGGVADTVLSVLIVIFLSLYLLVDPEGHQAGVIRLLPLSYRQRGREIIDRLGLTMRLWLKATLFSMVFVGIATWIGLALIGVQQAAALGVLAGLLSFIPNFGTIVALIPSLAVGIVQTPQSIIWIIVIIYGVSFIQTQILLPVLVAGSIRLPAVLVLLGQIIAGAFLGFLGLMLAVPITAIIMVLIQEVYVRDVLGDRVMSAQKVSEVDEAADGAGASAEPPLIPESV
jgi:predicted PurR-regulated permease PerM